MLKPGNGWRPPSNGGADLVLSLHRLHQVFGLYWKKPQCSIKLTEQSLAVVLNNFQGMFIVQLDLNCFCYLGPIDHLKAYLYTYMGRNSDQKSTKLGNAQAHFHFRAKFDGK